MLIDFTFLVFYFFFSCWFSRIEKFKLEFFYLQVMILCVRVVLKNLLRTEFAIHNGRFRIKVLFLSQLVWAVMQGLKAVEDINCADSS